MWLICGTIPDNSLPLCEQAVWHDSFVNDGCIILPDGRKIPVARGTAALAATAILTCQALDAVIPRLLFVGDCGKGGGSARAYQWLSANLARISGEFQHLDGLTLHYFYPDLDGHNRVFMSVQALQPRPILVADAGFMYVAKMSGYAADYDLFTPDMGELAFLADEKAPHPFYTRGFLLSEEKDAHALVQRAMKHGNSPRNLIVKGSTDYVVCAGEVRATLRAPAVEAMECIGGTGDIVTGFATAFLAAGFPLCQSAVMAARAGRCLAQFCQPTPATQAAELIDKIAAMLCRDWENIEKS